MKKNSSQARQRAQSWAETSGLGKVLSAAGRVLFTGLSRCGGNSRASSFPSPPRTRECVAPTVALILAFAAYPAAAQELDFLIIDSLGPTSNQSFNVLDLNDAGDVLYLFRDLGLDNVYLHRQGSAQLVWTENFSHEVIGSANHSGTVVLSSSAGLELGTKPSDFNLVAKGFVNEEHHDPCAARVQATAGKQQWCVGPYTDTRVEGSMVGALRIAENGNWGFIGRVSSSHETGTVYDDQGINRTGNGESSIVSGVFTSFFQNTAMTRSWFLNFSYSTTSVSDDSYGTTGGDQLIASCINRNLDLAGIWVRYPMESYTSNYDFSKSWLVLGINQHDVFSYDGDAYSFSGLSLSDNQILTLLGRHPANSSRVRIYQFGGGIKGEHTALNKLVSNPSFVEVNNRGDILVVDTGGKVSLYQGGVLKPVFTPGMKILDLPAISFSVSRGCFNNRGQIAGVVVLQGGTKLLVRFGPLPVRLKSLEVVQAIQDWKNSVPMLEGKPTYVRAHLEAALPEDAGRITAKLIAKKDDGTKLGELSPTKAPWNRAQFSLSDDAHKARAALTHTLNFELPAPWTKGTVTLSLEAEGATIYSQDPAEPGGAANDGTVKVTFLPPTSLKLLVVPVELSGQGHHVSAPSAADIQSSVDLLRHTLPISNLIWRRVNPRHEVLPMAPGSLFDNHLAFIQLAIDVAAQTRKRYQPAPGTIITAALSPDVVNPNGFNSGETGNSVNNPSDELWSIVGDGDLDRPSLAHELAHALGSHHPTDPALGPLNDGRQGHCKEFDPGSLSDTSLDYPYFYPYAGACAVLNSPPVKIPFIGPQKLYSNGTFDDYFRDEGIWGLELRDPNYLAIINPASSVDLMSYCNQCQGLDSWAGLKTYTDVLAYLGAHPREEAPPLPIVRGRAGGTLVVRGSLHTLSNTVAWLPVRCFPGETPLPATPGPYRVEARDAASNLLSQATFKALSSPETAGPNARWLIPFRVELPAVPDVALLQVWSETNLLASLTGSAHAPEVTVLSPNSGEKFAQATVEVHWQGADADGDPLVYTVQFSPDGGNTWDTLSLQTTETNLVVHREELPGSTNALFRVLVSDGFRTAEDQGDGPFNVLGGGPLVTWLHPTPGETLRGDEDIVLRALVDGRGGEEITETNLVWHSDRDGQLGTGSELRPTPRLTPGAHLLTLTATDSQGNATVVSNTIVIQPSAPPALGLQGFQTNGTVTLAVGGQVSSLVIVETSTNLVDWEEWQTVILEQSQQILTALISPEEPARFFRVRAGASGPTFLQQPEDVALGIGDTLHLSAQAVSAEPVDYYWLREGNPIVGVGNGPTLTITNLQVAQGGLYSVLASNRLGTAISRQATVTCRVSLLTSLTNFCYQGGESVTFQCNATGSPPLAYQWFKNGAEIAGATGTVFNVPAMATNDLGIYVVRATNSASTVYSTAALLACPLQITTHLTNQCYAAGQSVTFQIVVTGSGPFTYIWRKGLDVIPDATSPSYTLPVAGPDDRANYQILVTDNFGNQISDSAELKNCP